jgi:hypothetical protein
MLFFFVGNARSQNKDNNGNDGNQLWTIYRTGKHSITHQARAFDLDQDGIDEILTGFVMVDEKGNPMWIAHPSPHLSKIVLSYCNARRIVQQSRRRDLYLQQCKRDKIAGQGKCWIRCELFNP